MTGNSESNIEKNNDKNNDTDKKTVTGNCDDKSYKFSGSVDKGAVKEVESSGSGIGSGSEVSGSKGGNGVDGYIASVLEKGDELSPLQMILNYEIIFGLLILVHMSILILI